MKRLSWINVLGPIQGPKSENLAQLCSEREGDMITEEWANAKLLAFKMEEEGESQGMEGMVLRIWKRQASKRDGNIANTLMLAR